MSLAISCGSIRLQVFLPEELASLYRELLEAEEQERNNPFDQDARLKDVLQLKQRVKSRCMASSRGVFAPIQAVLPNDITGEDADVKELVRWLEAYRHYELMLTKTSKVPQPGWVSNPNKCRWRWFQCDSILQVLLPPDMAFRYYLFKNIQPSQLTDAEKKIHAEISTRFANACRAARGAHPYYGIQPTERRFALSWQFLFVDLDHFLADHIPQQPHQGVYIQNLRNNSTLNTKGGVSKPDMYGRCWINVDDSEQGYHVLVPPTATFQYVLYRHALRKTSWPGAKSERGKWAPIHDFLKECKKGCQAFTSINGGATYGYISDRNFHWDALDKALKDYERYMAGNSRLHSAVLPSISADVHPSVSRPSTPTPTLRRTRRKPPPKLEADELEALSSSSNVSPQPRTRLGHKRSSSIHSSSAAGLPPLAYTPTRATGLAIPRINLDVVAEQDESRPQRQSRNPPTRRIPELDLDGTTLSVIMEEQHNLDTTGTLLDSSFEAEDSFEIEEDGDVSEVVPVDETKTTTSDCIKTKRSKCWFRFLFPLRFR